MKYLALLFLTGCTSKAIICPEGKMQIVNYVTCNDEECVQFQDGRVEKLESQEECK